KECFLAKDVVTVAKEFLWLETREEALQVCKEMNEKIHCWEHVCGDHQIEDSHLFFRFTQDSTQQDNNNAGADGVDSSAAQQSSSDDPKLPAFKRNLSTAYTRQTYYENIKHMKETVEVKDRTYLLKTYKACFLAQDVVTVAQEFFKLETREEALQVCREMNEKLHCWEHVCGDHQIEDSYLFFRFTQDSTRQTGCLAEVMRSRRQAKEEEADHGASLSLIGDDENEADNHHQDLQKLQAAVMGETEALNKSFTADGNHNKERIRATRRGQSPRKPQQQHTRRTRERVERSHSCPRVENGDHNPTSTEKPARVPRRDRNGSQDSRRSRGVSRSTSSKRYSDDARRSNSPHASSLRDPHGSQRSNAFSGESDSSRSSDDACPKCSCDAKRSPNNSRSPSERPVRHQGSAFSGESDSSKRSSDAAPNRPSADARRSHSPSLTSSSHHGRSGSNDARPKRSSANARRSRSPSTLTTSSHKERSESRSCFSGKSSRRPQASLSPVVAPRVSQSSRRYQALKKKQDSLRDMLGDGKDDNSVSSEEEDTKRTYLPALAALAQPCPDGSKRGFERAASFKVPRTSNREQHKKGAALPPRASSGPPRLASIQKAKEFIAQKRETDKKSAVTNAVQR
ncbi:DEP domain containing MTOR-interacting protein (Partial), partial [Seminavis robusta]